MILAHPIRCDYVKLKSDEAAVNAYSHSHAEADGGDRESADPLKPIRRAIRFLHTIQEDTKQWNIVLLNP